MTAVQVVFSVVAWGFLLVAGWEQAVWEVRRYRASKAKRYKELLREIADLERELGLNPDDPDERFWRLRPRIYQPPGLTWSGTRSGIKHDE